MARNSYTTPTKPARSRFSSMKKASCGIAFLFAGSTFCMPATAADICDIAVATQTSDMKLFAATLTKYSGIFSKGDCKFDDGDVGCVREYTKAGAMELFSSSSGLAIAGIIGASFEQCGFVVNDESAGKAKANGDCEYIIEYDAPKSKASNMEYVLSLEVLARKNGKVLVSVYNEVW